MNTREVQGRVSVKARARQAVTFWLLLSAMGCAPATQDHEAKGAEGYEVETYDIEDAGDAGVLDDKVLPSKTYQAESYTTQSGCQVAKDRSGYTGTGFVDFGGNGTWIEWNNIAAAAAGRYELRFRYANNDSGNRPASILVNGASVANVSFSRTGSWTSWSTASTSVALRSGNNTIRVLASTAVGGPNLDSVDVVATTGNGAVTLNRIGGNELRIANYNVMRSSVFPLDNGTPGTTGTAARIAGFKRIAKAVNADIWTMQEVMYDGADQPGRTPGGLKKYMESLAGRTLYMAHHLNYQEFVFSRYPIDASGSVGHRTVWALIDVGNDNDRRNDVGIISVHFVSDGGGTDVANLVSSILAGKHTIPRDVTLVVAGDFNNQPSGPRYAAVKSAMGVSDVRPIWLGTANTTFTYGGLTFKNGAFLVPNGGNPIDFVFARPNSSYAVAKNYILGTLALSQSVLDAHGLQRMDTALDPGQRVSEGVSVNCDHLPLIVDLKRR